MSSSCSEEFKSQVILNVYDLTPINGYVYWFGFGIFHSGIEVHGMEYGYGAHEYPASGVFEVEPKSCPGFVYRNSIVLGHTTMPPSEFRAFLENMAAEYHGDTYHLITKNCNHFTDDLALRLTGKSIPGWINRLARLGAVCSCLLPESLQVSAVKQIPEYHECSEEDVSDSHLGTNPFERTESDEPSDHLLSTSASDGDIAFIKETSR
ncbi:hypothetical protein ACHQM5_029171 [Ranunculus cassubicifolius]